MKILEVATLLMISFAVSQIMSFCGKGFIHPSAKWQKSREETNTFLSFYLGCRVESWGASKWRVVNTKWYHCNSSFPLPTHYWPPRPREKLDKKSWAYKWYDGKLLKIWYFMLVRSVICSSTIHYVNVVIWSVSGR